MLVVGCGGPGPVGPRAFEHAQALYSVSNLQADDRVEMMAEKIDADLASGALTDHEANWLRGVVDDARDGDWKSAMQTARSIMKDQAGS